METLLLTLVGPARGVVPRRVVVDVRPGAGALHLPDAPPLDDAWRASVGHAWTAARRIAGRTDADARVSIPGRQALEGASAGLPLGIAFLAALTGRAPAPHFASGAVVDDEGRLGGGALVPEKARAAADLARQMRMPAWRFVAPLAAPQVEGVDVARVEDLAAAWREVAAH